MTSYKPSRPHTEGRLLIEAASNGDVTRVRKLIREGISFTDTEGRTALMHAAILGKVEVVKALIPAENGRIDANGCNALTHALLNEQYECAALLREYETVPEAWSQRCPMKSSPLMIGKKRKLSYGSSNDSKTDNENNPYVIVLRQKLYQQDTEIQKLRWEVKHLTEKLEANDMSPLSDIYLKNKEAERDEAIDDLRNSLAQTHALNGMLLKESQEWKEEKNELEKKNHELTHSLRVAERDREGLKSMVSYLQEQLQSSRAVSPSTRMAPMLPLDDPSDDLDRICRNLDWDQLEELPSDLLDLLVERLKEVLSTALILQGSIRERMCDICLSMPKNTILNPCKHCCVCDDCAESLIGRVCPRCSAFIDNYIIYRT